MILQARPTGEVRLIDPYTELRDTKQTHANKKSQLFCTQFPGIFIVATNLFQTHIHSEGHQMSTWWVIDKTGHKRGPLNVSHVEFLLKIGSVTHESATYTGTDSEWKPMNAHENLLQRLIVTVTDQGERSDNRLPLADVPATESIICNDDTCPKAPSCDLVYIWDRKEAMWLTFSEYSNLCREEGLTHGLPERVLAESSEQIEELLRQADEMASLGNKPIEQNEGNEDENVPFDDPQRELKRKHRREYRERRKLRREAGMWVASKSNPNVYVSCLPAGVTADELNELFKRAGQIKSDLKTGESRIKLYGNGDALITYVHNDSVKLARELLDGYEIRPNCMISVQEADFGDRESKRGATYTSLDELRAKAQLNRDSRKRLLEFYRKDRALKAAWDLADYQLGARKVRKVVVFRNCFDASQPDPVDYAYIEESFGKLYARFGRIKRVIAIRDSVDGFVCVKFETSQAAEDCVSVVDSAMDTPECFKFMGRPLTAFIHDGRDLYSRTVERKIEIPLEEFEERRELAWEEFLYEEVESDDEDIQIRTE